MNPVRPVPKIARNANLGRVKAPYTQKGQRIFNSNLPGVGLYLLTASFNVPLISG